MSRAELAYTNARVRARKRTLLSRDDLLRLAVSDTPTRFVPGWCDLSIDDSPQPLLTIVFERLVHEYEVALRIGPPAAAAALTALVQCHEIENVKLVWRALVRGRPVDTWLPLWRPLGRLARLGRDPCRSVTSLRALVALLASTPYGAIAADVRRAHAHDLGAAELAFDRWASSSLGEAIATLPSDDAARVLLSCLLVEREAAMLTRTGAAPASNITMARRQRQVAARRALQGNPYCLAPLFAYILAREDEARALLSIAETRVRQVDPVRARRAVDLVR